jgi:ribosomal protein S12 methylthiotransferase
MEIQQKISLNKNKQLIGKTIKTIIDEVYDEYVVARSQYDAPEIDNQILVYDTDLNPGDIIDCTIKEAYEYDLIGENIS